MLQEPSLLPQELQKEENIPACTMKLDPPIRSKIFNYRETVASLDVLVDEDISFVNNLPTCNCNNSNFCDPHHQHIVSGDLRIITNKKLRKLLSRGPNYREPKSLNYSKCKQSIESALVSSIDNLADKYKVNTEEFLAWKNKIIELVDERIKLLKSKNVPSATKPSLKDQEVLSALTDLHKNFVIVPIDKVMAMINKTFSMKRTFSVFHKLFYQ